MQRTATVEQGRVNVAGTADGGRGARGPGRRERGRRALRRVLHLLGATLAAWWNDNVPRLGAIVLLLWVYYSSQIVLLGAEFTRVYAERHGVHPPPQSFAEKDPDAARKV